MKKAEIRLVIEDDTVTFDGANIDQLTMKDLVDCVKELAGFVKMLGGTDLLIMASVISGLCMVED